MLAPRAAGAFVCLRCEAQIARRRLPAVPRRVPRANFSASVRRHDDGAETKDALSVLDPPQLKITRVVEPLNRVRRRKGKIVKETTASLGDIKQLGDNADILVLREIEDARAEEDPEEPEEIEPAAPVQVPDIFASLQQEGKAVTPEEIYQQVGSLRPKNAGDPNEPHYVTQATFLKLKNLLMNGFTQHQLMTFYSVAKNIKRGKVNKGVIDSLKRDEDNHKLPVERSEWQPGTTSITKRLPGVDRHVKIMGWRKNVSKQLLVDRILRDPWNLVLLEEIEAPGELELFLKPWQMALLTVGDHNVLDEIGLIRKVKFQVYKPHDILRITADKSTAEYAANDIEEALQHAETKRMDLKNYMRQLKEGVIPKDDRMDLTRLYSQKDLDVISALTKTSIAVTAKNLFTIRGFDNAAVEEAKRSLIKLLPLREPITHTSDMLNLGSARTSIYPAPIYIDKSLMDYHVRNAALGRLSIPHPRITGPGSADDAQEVVEVPKASKATLQGLVDRTTATILRSIPYEIPHVEQLSNWEADPSKKVCVKFGQALIPLTPVGAEEADVNASRLSDSTFVQTVPGLSSFLASTDLSVTARTQTPGLHYYFRPDPEQAGFDPSQLFPDLRVKMGTDRHGSKAYFRKASLRFWQHMHTVSLPNQAADLQFFQYGGLRWRKNYEDANLYKWIGAVQKSIMSGGRLTAPPLSIDIPKWTIPGFSSDDKGTTTVKYHFAGVEFKQAFSGSLLGESISFTAKQAGKLDAKGAELMAYYSGHGDTRLSDETAIKAFVKNCFDITGLITNASAQTAPLSRQVRPRYAESARKARRSETVDAASDPVDDVLGEAVKELQERVANYPSAQEDKKVNSVGNEVSAHDPATREVQHGDEGTAASEPLNVPGTEEEHVGDSSSKSI